MTDASGLSDSVTERTRIETFPGGIHFTEDDGKLRPSCLAARGGGFP